MESIKKDESPLTAVTMGSKLRYPLRSSSRSKAATAADPSESSSASRRVKPSASVSHSVGFLDLSAKDKSAKPPRRLSIPTKSAFSPHQPSVGSITPISETRLKGKSDTPLSDVSRSSSRRKFCVLSSVSYWLTQIKLSEAASKHSISLGFFKLALESGCEPLQRMREELKSYVHKHNLLADLGEPAKDVFQSYNMLEDFEKLKLSENTSQLQEEGNCASVKDVLGWTACTGAGNLKPKSLASNSLTSAEANKKDTAEKKVPVAKDKASNIKNPKHPVSVKNTNVNHAQKPSRKTGIAESGNAKVKSRIDKATVKKGTLADLVPNEEAPHEDEVIIEDKENMDSQSMDGAVTQEDIQTN